MIKLVKVGIFTVTLQANLTLEALPMRMAHPLLKLKCSVLLVIRAEMNMILSARIV